MTDVEIRVRAAAAADAPAVLALATDFATSFVIDGGAFAASYADLLRHPDAALLVAEQGDEVIGYVLGFLHPTLYANGPVAWVEEITVREPHRRQGIGRRLMTAFERWAAARDARLVALATRRAAPFYGALGYDGSATYFRKVFPGSAGHDQAQTDGPRELPAPPGTC